MDEYGEVVRRVNGVRQVWQRNLGHWKPVQETELLPEEFVEDALQGYQENPEVAEAAFEEIELSTFEGLETTPLLGGVTAGGGSSISAGAAGAAIGGAVVLGGSILGGLVKIFGGGGGSDDTEEPIRKDPILTIPGHKFLGPGNDDDDETPIDIDDSISKNHDRDYSKAKTQDEVHLADDVAIEQFTKDAVESGNIHSVIGAIGLGGKRVIETLTGVKYPANLPRSSSPTGMGLTRIKRAPGKYPIHNDPRKHPDFPKRGDHSSAAYKNRATYIWNAWNTARQNAGLVRVDPPARLGINVTMRPPMNRRTGVRPTNKSITFRQWRESGNISSSDEESLVAESLSSGELAEVEDIIREANAGGISLSDFDDRDGAGPSGVKRKEPEVNQDDISTDEYVEEEEADMGPTKKARVDNGEPMEEEPVQVAGGSGRTSKSDGGFDSAQGPMSFLMRGGYRSFPGSATYTKVHRIKGWAVPYIVMTSATIRGGSNLVSTCLVKIPWEYMFLYMSPEEFLLLPAGSYVKDCKIEVMQTVATTSFPTGSTTSTTASTNHPKVLVVGKDLERKCRGGVDHVLNLDANMKPTLAENQNNFEDFIAKQYGTDQTVTDANVVVPGCAHKIPYYNRHHFCIYQPDNAQAIARGFDATNSPGFEYFQNMITEVNSNDTTWDHIDTMYYKFENAPIGEQYDQLEIFTGDINQSIGSAQYYNARRGCTNLRPGGNTTITESFGPSSKATIPLVTYSSSSIEKGSHYTRGDSAGKPARQPSYHIGMRAIDRLDPSSNSSRSSSFVSANIEFEIKATMTVNFPSYPNRFVRPKKYNVSLENVPGGIGLYPNPSGNRIVTFGLPDSGAVAPAVAAVDQLDDEDTEDGMVCPPRRLRPRRHTPQVGPLIKKK